MQLAVDETAIYGRVRGEAVTTLPRDLYIPPDALEVILETFEGPLDLLLYLIKRQNLDVLDVPIAQITRQYMEYIGLMKHMRLALAAEYLLMAAMLAEIKSRMLLPRPVGEHDNEEDPRAELIRRLLEYERFKEAAQRLDEWPQLGRDTHVVHVLFDEPAVRTLPQVSLREMLLALKDVLARAQMFAHHHINREPLSVRARMSRVLLAVRAGDFVHFATLFDIEEGRRGVVVTLLAILELVKESLIEVVQSELFAPLYVRTASPIDVAGAA